MAGKSNKGAQRRMTLKGQTWWFKRDIPHDCRAVLDGKTAWLRSLETADVRIAQERRDILEIETGRMFADIRAGRWKCPAGQSASDRGNLWRETLSALSVSHEADTDQAGSRQSGTPTADELQLGWSLTPAEAVPDDLDIARHAEEAEREALRGAPKQAYEDALLAHVPVDQFLDAYLNVAKLTLKTKNARRGLINQFTRWCIEEKLPLDRIDRRNVGRYVTQRIDAMHPTTGYAHLIALRHYWVYLHVRGHISNGDGKGGPWVDQQIKDRSKRVERGSKNKERAFTAKEVITLLHSACPAGMKEEFQAQVVDALKMSLLSGMRMAEVLTLWAGEVHDGVFDIQQGKTHAAARQVPIHPDLVELVERRTKGKGPEEWLFHELQNERDAGDTFGKRFRRFRLKLGVDDKHDDKRRGLVNFHSARRWFIQSARDARHPRETVGNVVGHIPDKKDITFGVYTEGASDAHKRQCVESVRLPIAVISVESL